MENQNENLWTSARQDTRLADLYNCLEPHERYKLQKGEHRIVDRCMNVSYPQFLEEGKRMAKRKQKAGPDRSLTLKKIEPRTPNQQETVDAFNDDYNLVLHGVAGTGKTFLSLWIGLNEVMKGRYSKVIIVRSVVPSRDMGFLPGTANEKMAVYEAPYQKICSELFGRAGAYESLKNEHFIEFETTSHLRGLTLNDAIIIVDEIQNMNFEELDTVITRIGDRCRVIFCGDLDQSDLYRSKFDISGLPRFLDIIDKCESFSFVEFTAEDIVRSGIVKEWIIAKLRYNEESGGGN